MGRGHLQLTGPKLNSETLGTMSSHLCLQNRLSIPRWGGSASGLVAPARRPQNRAWADALGEVRPPRRASPFRRQPHKLARLEALPPGPDLLAAPGMLQLFPRETAAETDPPLEIFWPLCFQGKCNIVPGEVRSQIDLPAK